MTTEVGTIHCGVPKALADEARQQAQLEGMALRDFVADALQLRLGLGLDVAGKIKIQAERYGVSIAEYLAAAVAEYDPAKGKDGPLKQSRGRKGK